MRRTVAKTSQNFLLGRSSFRAHAPGDIILARPIKMAKTPSQEEDQVKMKMLRSWWTIANILCWEEVISMRIHGITTIWYSQKVKGKRPGEDESAGDEVDIAKILCRGRSNFRVPSWDYITPAQQIKMAKTPNPEEDQVKIKALVMRWTIAKILCLRRITLQLV